MKLTWKIKGFLLSKRKKMLWNHKKAFLKSTKIAHWEAPWKTAYSEHSIAIHSIPMVGYITPILAFVHTELCAREASSFCIFEKLPLAFSLHFTLFFGLKQTFVFEMCLVRSSSTNLCPIVSHLNALNFIECCSEEVITFFDAQCIF